MQRRLFAILITIVFAMIICGASTVAAANDTDNFDTDGLTTSNSIQLNESQTNNQNSMENYGSNVTEDGLPSKETNSNSSESTQSTTTMGTDSTAPDPQIWRNGVPVARGFYPAGYVFSSIYWAMYYAQDGDTIMLESGATFTETFTVSKNLSFDVLDNGRATISGSNSARRVTVSSGCTVTFNNIDFINGNTNRNGGAITSSGTLILNNCTFSNNRADGNGGAIYSTGTLTINNCNFTSNAAASGGAIYANGVLTITGSKFTSNTGSSDGGAIYSNNGLIITNSSFTSNTASMNNNGAGGAICQGDSTTNIGMNLVITNCTFTSNQGQHGGAIWTNAGTSANSATITNTSFTSNVGIYGGAIRNWGILTISKSNFTSNSATQGGALNNYNNGRSILTVTESNLLYNSATTGGALYNDAGTSELHFNRIVGNSGTDVYRSSGVLNAQNNWWGTNLEGSTPLAAGKVNNDVNATTWLVLKINANPNLIKVGGTSTVTATLTYDNAGTYYNPASGHVPDGIIVDFSGTLGTIPDGSMVNGVATSTFTAGSKPGVANVSAAVDSQTVNTNITIGRDDVYVSPTGSDTTGDGSSSNPFQTISAGIAGVYPGGTVHILNGTYNSSSDRNIVINKNMTIVGSGASSTILNAQLQGNFFNITSGSTVRISGLTLANGSITGNGGAINNAGNLTLTECNLLNNTATGNGKTIYNTGNANITFNRIIGNGVVIYSTTNTVNATNNWWGNNSNPSSNVSSNVNVSRWLVLTVGASPTLIKVGNTSTVTADVTHDNTGADTSSQGHIPDGIPIGFVGTLGNVSSGTTVNGRVIVTFTAGPKPGIAVVNATSDNQTVSASITIGRDEVYVSPDGNDATGDGSAEHPFKTISAGIAGVYPGGTIQIASGTYNEHDLVINKNVTIAGSGASTTIINAQEIGRIFNITSGNTASISGLTLANASATGNGGAINNAGNLTLTENNLLNNTATGTGGTIYNTGNLIMHFNKINGTGNVIASPSGSVDAKVNWWVSNDNPSSKVSGNVDVSTWLVLRVTASPNIVQTGETSLITADLTHNQNGVYYNPSSGHVPDGIVISFSSTLGTVNPGSSVMVNGVATTTFTATSPSGTAVVNATGSPTVSTDIDILGEHIYVSPTGSDSEGDGSAAKPYATIKKAVEMTAPGGTLTILSGTYTGAGNYDVTIDKNINIVGSGANSTIIDAQSLGRIFDITDGSTVSITNLTLQNGRANGNGGAINNAGNLTITGCNLLNNTATGTGSAIYNTGNAEIHFNRIIGSGILINSTSGAVDATNNWWGSNADPSSKVSTGVDVSTWLVLTVSASPNVVAVGGTSTITADLIHNNLGVDTSSLGHVPDGISILFNTTDHTLGVINPELDILRNGLSNSRFTAINTGLPNISVSLDNEMQNTNIRIYDNVTLSVTNYAWLPGVYTYNYKQQVVMLAQVNNLGNTAATNIVVKYVIGKAFKVISYNLIQPGTLSFDEDTNTFTWVIDILEGGNGTSSGSYASFSVLLESLKVGSGTSDFSLNSTIVSCDQNNIGATKTRVRNLIISPAADIQVDQTVNNTNPQQGDYVTITVKVKNNGPSNATGINITNMIPDSLYVGSLDINTGFTLSLGSYDLSTGIWSISNLNNNTEATLTIIARVDAVSGTQITNRAYRSGIATQYDWFTANDASIINITVNASSKSSTNNVTLSVTNYAWLPGVYTYNYKQQVVMLAQVNNLGNTAATNIVVKYVIGKAFKVISYNLIQPGTLSFDEDTNTFTWVIDILEGGNGTSSGSYASFSVLLESLKVGSGTSDFSLNSTIVSCDQNNIGATKTRVRNLIISPAADIQVDQTVNNTNPQQGDYVTITVKVKNNGPSNATGINITNMIPDSLYVGSLDINTGFTLSLGSYDLSTGIWSISNLNNNTEATLTIIARVDAVSGTQITNRAYRSGIATQYDWFTANDSMQTYILVN
ncbi:beta strand repeat-containing protein [Methanobacterium alcaliphilum]|uniref:beta strand repeat-containing protein n=1 Tax=Methanobacterium alcaliphilum TaxID=392018 RepID=UPI00200AC34D|nr:DUF11 domain-containing protein [Methanobacterium alcaliphilum]MCK9150762.1 DUF1565 domain-containing protein [Methanobacterium alcaliphilum]